MNEVLILFVGCIYLIIGLNFIYQGKIGFGIVFIGYAFSNYGLYLTSL